MEEFTEVPAATRYCQAPSTCLCDFLIIQVEDFYINFYLMIGVLNFLRILFIFNDTNFLHEDL